MRPKRSFVIALLAALSASSAVLAHHPENDSCPDTHINGGESIDHEITVVGTGQPVVDGMILPTGTSIRFHLRATAFGRCETFYFDPNAMQCAAGLAIDRKVAHIQLNLHADAGSLNSLYDLGRVSGKDPNGLTAFYQVLDTHDLATSTGPKETSLFQAGSYRFEMVNRTSETFCDIQPRSVKKVITVFARDSSKDENLGCRSDASVGNPCNVATGNKYQREIDVAVGPLPIVRHYNSKLTEVDFGLGYGWLTSYQRRLQIVATSTSLTIRHRQADGYAELFTRSTQGTWVPESDSTAALTEDASGYTVLYSTRSRDRYDLTGRLVEATDDNGMTISLSYDASGRLNRAYDPHGHALNFSYDVNNRIQSIDAGGGAVVGYEYDARGNLFRVTYADGRTREYLYENTSRRHYLTGIEDEAGTRFGTYAYDSSGRVISSQHANGAGNVSLSYTTGTSTSVTDAFGVARAFTFSQIKNAYRITGIGGQACAWCSRGSSTTYDVNANATVQRDFRQIETRYSYDLTRNTETSRTEAFGTPAARTIATTWHPTLRFPTQIDEPGKRTTLTYGASGNVLTKTVLDTGTNESRTWTYTYDTFNRILTVDGPRTDVADVTTYTYHACATGAECGQVHTITNALGHVTTYGTYNAHGQPLTITDSNGVLTTLTYDLRQRLTSRTVAGEQTTFTYWPTGLLERTTMPDGSYLEHTYDAAHRLTDIHDADGNRIHYTLDAMGNRTSEEVFDNTQVLTRRRTQVFNTLGQLWRQIGATGGANVTTTFAYDNNDNRTSSQAPLGRNTTQTYDELNRLRTITDPGSGLTTYGYDALDQLISVTDPKGLATSYSYNGLGDLKQQVSPDTGTTTNTFDAAGNLQASTDARNKTATYQYDALNRVTSATYADQVIGYTYDAGTNQRGRLTQITDDSGSTSWSYDVHGRVLARQQSIGAISKSVGYSYDASGRLQALTLPSGNFVTYGYANGKVDSLTLNGSTTLLSNVLYEPFGSTKGWTWGNSTLMVREYDQDGNITLVDSAGLKTYAYDDAFRITGISDASDPSLDHSFGYDLLDRVTSATGAILNQSWTYDANGNRLTQGGSQPSTYTVSAASNRINAIAGSLSRSYVYDNAGNTTSDGAATYSYNDAGRMVSSTNAGITTTYALNGLGQRVRKTTGGTSTYFVYDDAGHLIGEYAGSGDLIAETIWFGDMPVAVLEPNGSGGVNAFYIHADHLNTPRRITRPSDNAMVWRWDADPFGTTAANEDPSGLGVFRYNLRFPGQYYDSESGLHYNYYRDYDPSTGRYIESDPLGLRGGINTYAYAESNPVALSDPFGLLVCNGKWRQWGELITQLPALGWQTPAMVSCRCFWMCVPCRGPWAYSDMYSLPSTKGTTVTVHGGGVNPGSGGIRPTRGGPAGGPSGTMGGRYACIGCEKPGIETGCNDGRCYSDSNW